MTHVVREQVTPLILWNASLTPTGLTAPVTNAADTVRFNERYALGFIPTVQRAAEWTFMPPSWCQYPKLLLTLNFSAPADGPVKWQVDLEILQDGDDTSSAAYSQTAVVLADVATNKLRQVSFSIDAPAIARRLARLRLTRLGDDPDDKLDASAYLFGLALEEVRT